MGLNASCQVWTSQTVQECSAKGPLHLMTLLCLLGKLCIFILSSTAAITNNQHYNFPGGSESKESSCNAGEPGSSPGSGRSPGKGNGNPLQYSCMENFMDRGAWWAAVLGVAKSRTRLSDFTFTLHFHALEKEMATHSSVLAWRTPGTAGPGGLPSMGSHRLGHD